jgi:hypothetical protein
MALFRRSGFASSRLFVVWNLLGILDLVVAVGMGALSSGFLPGLGGNVTTAAMAQLPLVLIPAYRVPLFVMLHVAVLIQARRHASAAVSTATSAVPARPAFLERENRGAVTVGGAKL